MKKGTRTSYSRRSLWPVYWPPRPSLAASPILCNLPVAPLGISARNRTFFGTLQTLETALGMSSRSPEQANAQRVLATNRGHWAIENSCHYIIDWNFDEDRSRIRTGHGPENVMRLRRFAVGVIKFLSKDKTSVAAKMSTLNRNVRLVFDYLRMTKNSSSSLSDLGRRKRKSAPARTVFARFAGP